jgi:dCMP deaminase
MKALKFMAVAEAMRDMSKDPSTKVGAVAIDDDFNVLTPGYNGFPRGVKDTEERLNNRELKYQLTVHAEGNIVAQAARKGVSLKDSTVVVTSLFPCSNCSALMIQAGVKRIIATKPDNERWAESNKLAMEILKEAEVEVIIVEQKDGVWVEAEDPDRKEKMLQWLQNIKKE